RCRDRRGRGDVHRARALPDRDRPRLRQRPAGHRRRRRDRRPRRPTVAADLIALHVTATETDAVAKLPGGPIAYTLRRSPRSRGLRVVIHPDRGMVVTVPLATRRGWANPEGRIREFL